MLEHSTFEFREHWNHHTFPNAYNLELKVTPDIYTKHYRLINPYSDVIRNRINTSTKLAIGHLTILPDYKKLKIINSKVFPIITEWEEINQLQIILIEKLRQSSLPVDFQGIGLTCRTIMDKVARKVFNPNKHINSNKHQINNGKFKNQIHAFIDSTLKGEVNREFRKLAVSSITFVEDSIDFMNTTTHKLDAEQHLAEVCVISTIGALSIIKLINELDRIASADVKE